MREARRVVVDNLPGTQCQHSNACIRNANCTLKFSDPTVKGSKVWLRLVELFSSFDILASRDLRKDPTSKPGQSGWAASLDFESSDDAQLACDMYDKTELLGVPLSVFISRPSMKHLGGHSWDGGRVEGHGRKRDYGSAKGTNFEKVREIYPFYQGGFCPMLRPC